MFGLTKFIYRVKGIVTEPRLDWITIRKDVLLIECVATIIELAVQINEQARYNHREILDLKWLNDIQV